MPTSPQTYTLSIGGTSQTLVVSNQVELDGLTAAMNRANAAMPATVPDPHNAGQQIANPVLYANEQSYLQHVLGGVSVSDLPTVAARALRSYAAQNGADVSGIPDPDAPTPSDLAPSAPVVVTTKSLNEYNLAKLKAISFGGLAVNVGTQQSPILASVDTTDSGRIDVLGMLQEAALGATSFTWYQTSYAGNLTLTPQQITTIGLAIASLRGSAYAAWKANDIAINASPPTITTPSQIDAAAWPANS